MPRTSWNIRKRNKSKFACYVQCWEKSINRKILWKELKILILKFKFIKKRSAFFINFWGGGYPDFSGTTTNKKNFFVCFFLFRLLREGVQKWINHNRRRRKKTRLFRTVHIYSARFTILALKMRVSLPSIFKSFL